MDLLYSLLANNLIPFKMYIPAVLAQLRLHPEGFCTLIALVPKHLVHTPHVRAHRFSLEELLVALSALELPETLMLQQVPLEYIVGSVVFMTDVAWKTTLHMCLGVTVETAFSGETCTTRGAEEV